VFSAVLHGVGQDTDPLDLHFEYIARLHVNGWLPRCSDASRRAGDNHVTSLQAHRDTDHFNQCRDTEDEQVGARILHHAAIQTALDAQSAGAWRHGIGRHQGGKLALHTVSPRCMHGKRALAPPPRLSVEFLHERATYLSIRNSRAAGTIFHMTAIPTNAIDAARVLEEAGKWQAIADSAEMSEKQWREFHVWLDEPRNRSALAEVQALVTLIQALPENKAAALRKQRVSLRSIELDRRGFLTRPLSAITVAAAAVSAGASAFGLSATLASFVDLFLSGSSTSTAMPSGAAFAMCCGAGLAGSIWGALFFRRTLSE
jgi:hypothetical protein